MIPVRRWPAEILVAPIRFYQRFITPYTPATCRYYPTCSAYAVTALRTRGALVGTVLTIWRLLRCNPWSDGGIDHVPVTGLGRNREPNTSRRSSSGGPDRAESGSAPGPAEPTGPTGAGDPADWSGAPPTRGRDSKIGRFVA